MQRLLAFFRDSRGATSAEYAILAALVAGVVVAAVTGFGLATNTLFTNVRDIFP